MWQALLDVVVPVFVVAGVGFGYTRLRGFPLAGVTDLIVHLTGAALVFDALVAAPRFDVSSLRAPASAALLVLAGLTLGLAARAVLPPLRRLSLPAVVLPVAFMNAGNLGLPLADLALGPSGLEVAMLFFVTFSALHYSIGIALARGKGGAFEVFKLPLLYAAVLGVVVNQLQVELPKAVSVPIHLLGQTVIPLMLLSLGASLANLVKRERPSDAAESTRVGWLGIALLPVLRIGGGIGAALLINLVVGNEGLVAKVTLLVGCMPPAVMNFALIEKYRRRPEETAAVSAAIALGTLLSMAVIPLVVASILAS